MIEWECLRRGHEWRAYVGGEYTGYRIVQTQGWKNIRFAIFKNDIPAGGKYSYYLKTAQKRVEGMVINECEK